MTASGCTSRKLLLEAFALPESEALASWKRWRDARDLNDTDPAVLHLLPVVAHGRAHWLAEDPARAVIQGLCRRAWSHNQIAFHSLARVVGALRHAGIEPVVLRGSAAVALLLNERKTIWPIESLEILIGREAVRRAIETLAPAGWKLLANRPAPVGRVLDHFEDVWLAGAAGARLKLSWRLLPCAPECARDRERFPPLQLVELLDTRVELLPPEEMLVDALLGHREEYQLDWRWDALAVLAVRQIAWNRVAALLMDGDERGRPRLRELKDEWKVAIPDALLQTPTVGALRGRMRRVRRDYRWNNWNSGVPPSFRGFTAYCIRRWWRAFIRQGSPE